MTRRGQKTVMAFKPSDTDKTQRMVGRLPSAGLFHLSKGLDNQSLEELDHAVDLGSGVGVPQGLAVSGRATLPLGWALPGLLQTITIRYFKGDHGPK